MSEDTKKKKKTRAQTLHGHEDRAKKIKVWAQRPIFWRGKWILAGEQLTMNGIQYKNGTQNGKDKTVYGENKPSKEVCEKLNKDHADKLAERRAEARARRGL